MIIKFRLAKTWTPVYADDPPAPKPPETPPPTPPADPPVEDDKPTISQKKLNDILAIERKKHQDQQQKAIDQLEQAKKAKGLSDKEKTDLAAQIDDLKNSLLTKEQLAAQEKKKVQEELSGKVKAEQERADRNWKLYESSTIQREITDAAVEHEAFRPSQLIRHLKDQTSLVEDKDPESGQTLGTYSTRVKFPDVKDGKPITLDLTVKEAVKRMKDLPEEYGNLFKSGVSGGLGGSNGSGLGGGNDSEPPADPAKYRAWREKQKKSGKL